ncbi:MAG TPA: NADH-quinone oxidoreductase subunit L, partial [Vicinamibacterales bacterium]|nr:NADH-quinone oxidoreductase subunit L [Vicinamibacterales bacterium]
SAQIPLYTWLPDAMEGPTPVSALIHAATMVTAGVYMIGRNAVLFSHAPATMLTVAIIGALTALMAGTIGLVQNDIKRVLAYSTVSQLGLMFLAMGMGAFGAGIFHLYTHAFFKALLFLGSGAVIHALHGEQDIRNMGGLRRYLPITYWTFLIGSLAIAGVPGLAGFFSKDEILYETYHAGHWILWTMAAVTSLLTATYMFRLVFLTFHGERREDAHLTPLPSHVHDAPSAMALVLIVLAIGSAVAGYVGVPSVLGGQNRLGEWLEPSFQAPGETVVAGGIQAETGVVGGLQASGAETESEAENAALELTLMAISSAIAIAGIALAAFIWLRRRDLAAAIATRFSGVYRLLLNKYYVDEVYDAAVVKPIRTASEHVLWQGVDVGVIDGAVNGTALVVATGSGMLRRLQTGSVRAYAGSMFIGVIVILGFYLWR